MRKIVVIITTLLVILILLSLYYSKVSERPPSTIISQGTYTLPTYDEEKNGLLHPLQITQMRKTDYPGSELTIEKPINDGNGFNKYIAFYFSDGLKIKGLLTIPYGETPEGGWPAIIFNHGYIRPESYRREEKYVAYIAGFASKGYVVFMPDYRFQEQPYIARYARIAVKL